jgi:hypothetical protein
MIIPSLGGKGDQASASRDQDGKIGFSASEVAKVFYRPGMLAGLDSCFTCKSARKSTFERVL